MERAPVCQISKSLPVPNLALTASSKSTLPVNVPPASGIFVAILLVTVVEKLASSPRAAASSLRVSRVPGAESTKPATSVST